MIQPGMIWIGWITLATLVCYIGTALIVSRTRGRVGIFAPQMSGHPDLERALRVQANMLEQLVPFLTALWLCAWAWAPLPAAILGIVWLFGRVLYAAGYYREAKKRAPGFMIAMVALILLMIGAAYGLIRLGIVLS